MKKLTQVVVGLALFLSLIAFLWNGFYPDYYDPKNIHYVLWKWHLAKIDLDRAVAVMPHAQDSESLILGLNTDELRERFGYLRTPAEVDSYLRDNGLALARDHEEVFFIRNSHYAVYFTDGIARRVVLIEG